VLLQAIHFVLSIASCFVLARTDRFDSIQFNSVDPTDVSTVTNNVSLAMQYNTIQCNSNSLFCSVLLLVGFNNRENNTFHLSPVAIPHTLCMDGVVLSYGAYHCLGVYTHHCRTRYIIDVGYSLHGFLFDCVRSGYIALHFALHYILFLYVHTICHIHSFTPHFIRDTNHITILPVVFLIRYYSWSMDNSLIACFVPFRSSRPTIHNLFGHIPRWTDRTTAYLCNIYMHACIGVITDLVASYSSYISLAAVCGTILL